MNGETANGFSRRRAECPASPDCASAVVIGPGSAAGESRCHGGNGSGAAVQGGWTGNLPAFTAESARRGDLLARLGRESGLPLRAPRLNDESHLTLRLDPLPAADWIGSAARQLGTVPVRHASGLAVELMPAAEIAERHFSAGRDGPLPVARFHHQDVVSKVLMIAHGGNVDRVAPEGLIGTVEGDYSGLGWRAAMEAILRYSGNSRPVSVAPNGLAVIAPGTGSSSPDQGKTDLPSRVSNRGRNSAGS